MTVERTFSVVRNPQGDTKICLTCPIQAICFEFVDQQNGEILKKKLEKISEQPIDYSSVFYVMKTATQAATCRKSFPNYKIKETTPQEIHRIVGRDGSTIVESSSCMGMIGKYLLIIIMSILFLSLIALICSSIGSLFN